MKKLISIILAVIMIISTCICGLSVMAANPCTTGHTVTTWKTNGKVNHVGTCSICGVTVKKAHELVKTSSSPATCTEGGYAMYACSEAGCTFTTKDDETLPTGHSVIKRVYNYDPNGDGVIDSDDDMYMQNEMGQWIEGKDGVDDYILTTYCSNGDCVTVEYKSRGNSNICKKCYGYTLLSKTVYEATCGEDGNGYTEYVCSISQCGVNGFYNDDYTPPAEHDFESEIIAPKCEESGFTLRKCKNYGCTEVETANVLDPLGHDFSTGEIDYVYNAALEVCTVSGVCTRCGESKSETLENTPAEKCGECGSAILSKKVKINGCTTTGKVTINCSNPVCGSYDLSILPLGHTVDTVTYEYFNGKCVRVTENCIKCGEATVTDSASIAEKEFSNATTCIKCTTQIQKRVITNPTCDRVGFTKVTCPECGPYTESTKLQLNHDSLMAEWKFNHTLGTMIFSATCDVAFGCGGYTFEGTIGNAAVCSKCGKNALTYKKTVHPTCISDGYTIETCGNCVGIGEDGSQTSSTYVYDIPSTGKHNFVSKVFAPTCEGIGYTESTCKDCFYSIHSNKVAATGHDGTVKEILYNRASGTKTVSGDCKVCMMPYTTTLDIEPNENVCVYCGNATILRKNIKAPSCSKETGLDNGIINSYCGGCGKTNVEYITASHKFGAWETTKKATCAQRDADGKIIDLGGGANPSDGLRSRKCSSCGYVEENVIKANEKHAYLIHTPGKEPTCTEDGYAAIRKCTICGEQEGVEIVDGRIVAKKIEATGHLLSPGTKNANFCVYCNSYLVTKWEDGKEVIRTDDKGNEVYYVVDVNGKYVYEEDESGFRKLKETTNPDNNDEPAYVLTACACMHHNADGLAKFVFNIILFFCKLLGINQTCDCGEPHFE